MIRLHAVSWLLSGHIKGFMEFFLKFSWLNLIKVVNYTTDTGSCSTKKKVLWGVFLSAILKCSGLCGVVWKKKSCFVESRSALAKLCILPKTLGCSFILFACFLQKWWCFFLFLINWQAGISGKSRYSVEWFNKLWNTPVLNLFLAPEHLNSCRDEPVLIFDKMTCKKREEILRMKLQSLFFESFFTWSNN